MSEQWRGAFLSGHINFQVFEMVQEPGRITLRLSRFWLALYVLAALVFGGVAPVALAATWEQVSQQPWKLVLVGLVAVACWVWLYYLLFRSRRIEIALDAGNVRFYTHASDDVDFLIEAGDIDRLELRRGGLYLHTRDGAGHHLFQTTGREFAEGVLAALATAGPLAEIAKAAGKEHP